MPLRRIQRPRVPTSRCATCNKILTKWKVIGGVIKCLACRRGERTQRRQERLQRREVERQARERARQEREAQRRVREQGHRVPEGEDAIVRKEGSGKDATEAITSRSTRGIKVFKAGSRFAPREAGWLIRWGYTGDAPRATRGVINEARAISATSDKTTFRRLLDEKGLCPKTWVVEGDVQFPAVVRPRYHSGGRDVILVRNIGELRTAIQRVGAGWYAATYVDKVEEYRIFVVSGRVGWVAKKTPPTQAREGEARPVAWNHTFGAVFENVRFDEWPLKACKVAIEAFKFSGLDFGAVDVIIDRAGKPYVLEINTAIALESPYRSERVAKCFDYMLANGKAVIPLVEARGGWRKFAHPAIADGVRT